MVQCLDSPHVADSASAIAFVETSSHFITLCLVTKGSSMSVHRLIISNSQESVNTQALKHFHQETAIEISHRIDHTHGYVMPISLRCT